MSFVRGDPFWMKAKFAGKCSGTNCNDTISKGQDIFYYPKTKSVFVGKCADSNYRDYRIHASSEDGDMY